MKDLATLLARSEAYEQHHAQWVAAGIALAAERESIIAFGKTLGHYVNRLQADLPKVPNLRAGADEVPAGASTMILTVSPPCVDFTPSSTAAAITAPADIAARVAEVDHLFEGPAASAAVQPDERLCQDMTDDEIVLGHVDIVHRGGGPGPWAEASDTWAEWMATRRFAFEQQIQARGLTPRILGAMSYRLNIRGNAKPFTSGSPEAQEWTAGWLDAQPAKTITNTAEKAA